MSGEAALSSAGRSMVGSSFSSLAKLVRFANNVTTRNRMSSFVEGSNKYINRRGAWNKEAEGLYQTWSTEILALRCGTIGTTDIPYILESNPRHFYSFRGLKNQMQIRIACGLDSRSWAGFWKNDRAAVRAIRTIQYNNLLFYLLFITLYNILHNI